MKTPLLMTLACACVLQAAPAFAQEAPGAPGTLPTLTPVAPQTNPTTQTNVPGARFGPVVNQPPVQGNELTLRQAVVLARDNSLAAQASRATLASAQAQRQAAFGAALPTLSLETSPTYTNLPPTINALFGAFGPSLSAVPGFPMNGTYFDNTIAASMPLFDAFATSDALKIADLTIQADQLGLVGAEQDAMTSAAVSYFEVLRQQGLADVAGDTVKQALEHLRLGDLRLRAGTGTRADVLQLRAQLANAQSQLTQVRNAVNVARLTLSNTLNAPVTNRPLLDPVVPHLAVAIDHELMPSLGRRTDVRQALARRDIDENRINLASRALLPHVNGQVTYLSRGLNAGEFTAAANVQWQVFDGLKTRANMDAARAEARADEAMLEQARQGAALQIRQQYQNREEAMSRVQTSREGLAAAQEAYRLALRRYQVGLATTFELTDVQNTLVQASNNYVQAVDDLRTAEIRLARAMGYDIADFLGVSRIPPQPSTVTHSPSRTLPPAHGHPHPAGRGQ